MLYLRREIFQETMSLKVVCLVLLLSMVANLGECGPLKYVLRDTLKPQRTHRLMSRGKAVYGNGYGENQRTVKSPCMTDNGGLCELSPRL